MHAGVGEPRVVFSILIVAYNGLGSYTVQVELMIPVTPVRLNWMKSDLLLIENTGDAKTTLFCSVT